MGASSRGIQGKLARMTDDLVLLVFAAGILAGGYKIWHISLDAREAANRIAKDTCSRAVVQFLDGTVAFAGFRLARDCARQAPAAAHLHLRLHQRRLRARAGLHRAGRPAPGGRRARGQPLVNATQYRLAHPFELLRRLIDSGRIGGARPRPGVEVLALTDHDTVAGLEEADIVQAAAWAAPRARR